MADTGAELPICISKKLAQKLQLTWKKGSMSLTGVGGTGGALGIADQRVRVRLGGQGNRPGATDIGALQGCFTMSVKPIILTDELTKSIGHQVILGQVFLHHCLASFDAINETMEISPAFMSHKCADFRVSIPVTMSYPSKVTAWLHSGTTHESVESFMDGCSTTVMTAGTKGGVRPTVTINDTPTIMPLHPGKPQKGEVPTREEYDAFRKARATPEEC
jgi:hypothetical protein